MPRLKARASRCSRNRSARNWKQLVKRVEHCRLETHPRFFDFFVEGCQFKPVEYARRGGRVIELVDTFPTLTSSRPNTSGCWVTRATTC